MHTLTRAYRRSTHANAVLHCDHDEARVALFLTLRKRYDEQQVLRHWERINKILDEQRNEA